MAKRKTRSKAKSAPKPSLAKLKAKAKPADKQEVIKRIVDAAGKMLGDINRGTRPVLRFPIRSLSNVSFDPKVGHFELLGKKSERTLAYSTVKTFAQSIRMMSSARQNILDNEICSKREMYYNSKGWAECRFNEQPESDTVMDDIEAFFGVNREQLGFIPDERGGDVAGDLVIIDKDWRTGKNVRIDCTKQGSGAWSIPSKVEHLAFETKAKFVLVVETSALFQRLVYHGYWSKQQCIIVAMSGVPTRACRRFIRRLADEKRLPVYVFTDGDPYGYGNIYRTLKVGSGNAAHINKFFCVPQAHFLGVTPQDIIDFDLHDATHPLAEVDIKRAKDALKNDPFIKTFKQWQDALNQMIKMGVRVEQQAFAKHGLNFVIENYLPAKLKNVDKFLP
jgi:DNA topoisomerase VI subunit A